MNIKNKIVYKCKHLLYRSEYPVSHFGIDFNFYVRKNKDILRAENLIYEIEFCKWLLDDLGVFWDIGSYHGHYSIIADNVGFEVYAFEPVKDNLKGLYLNQIMNDTYFPIHNVALGEKNKRISMRDNKAESNVSNGGDVDMYQGDYLARSGLVKPPTHIKIDVEGYEKNVLLGLNNILNNLEKILIEIHNDEDIDTIKQILKQKGFQILVNQEKRSQTYVMGAK